MDLTKANKSQNEAINHLKGPLLIIAGPGTGKTYTLVKRATNLMKNHNIKPNNLMIVTFTNKAANEIISRISSELINNNIDYSLDEMYIGTFHSICLKLIKENVKFSNLADDFIVLDEFDQDYFIYRNIYKFRKIEGLDNFSDNLNNWDLSKKIKKYVNILNEELVDYNKLLNSTSPKIVLVGQILKLYEQLRKEQNVLDFSTIQTTFYKMLKENHELLLQLKEKIKHIMVDEYQDTNFIQEKIIFTLLNDEKNVCVVGDDDQGLYRFRGATIRNILEFPSKFDDECKIIKLEQNYRSEPGIIDFYNNWMSETKNDKYSFSWGKFRFKKNITSDKEIKNYDTTVSTILADSSKNESVEEKVLSLITTLKKDNKISDLNQISFLFNSVKNPNVLRMFDYLERNGINVYSPRSDLFFKRKEVQLLIGIIIKLFPVTGTEIFKSEEHYFDEIVNYYKICLKLADEEINKPENYELSKFVKQYAKEHLSLNKNLDYSYSGLIYKMFEFKPFSTILDTDLKMNTSDTRPIRNLSIFLKIIAKFELLNNISVITKNYIDKNTEKLFLEYLNFLYIGGLSEFEDDYVYAPSGCVSFLTFHQAKGLEFPIVIVGSLEKSPVKSYDDLIYEIEGTYFNRPKYEPIEDIKYFDFWRLYYTAFSRAKNLLILIGNKNSRGKEPSEAFKNLLLDLNDNLDISKFNFEESRELNIKRSYSFTSDVQIYDNCSVQYKFFRDLEFTPVRTGVAVFGQLVHKTLEDIHKAVMEDNTTINKNLAEEWFKKNYESISKREGSYLQNHTLKGALDQINNYIDVSSNYWLNAKQTEISVSLVKDRFILNGKIDLVVKNGTSYEIVDFKTEKKPILNSNDRKVDKHKNQLEVYTHLLENKLKIKVAKSHIYYTSESESNPNISFITDNESVKRTILKFEQIVLNIQDKKYYNRTTDTKICKNCDMRFYCKKYKE